MSKILLLVVVQFSFSQCMGYSDSDLNSSSYVHSSAACRETQKYFLTSCLNQLRLSSLQLRLSSHGQNNAGKTGTDQTACVLYEMLV